MFSIVCIENAFDQWNIKFVRSVFMSCILDKATQAIERYKSSVAFSCVFWYKIPTRSSGRCESCFWHLLHRSLTARLAVKKDFRSFSASEEKKAKRQKGTTKALGSASKAMQLGLQLTHGRRRWRSPNQRLPSSWPSPVTSSTCRRAPPSTIGFVSETSGVTPTFRTWF